MKNFAFMLLALLSLSLCGFTSSKAFLNDYFFSENTSDSFLEDSSIADYDDEKIYLNFDRLVFTTSGIFLRNDYGILVSIRRVSFSNGIYCLVREGTWRCPECGNINDNNWRSCHRCGFFMY